MQTIKSKVFNYLTKNQKSELCHYVAKFVQKNISLNAEEILEKYLEEEQYYLDINSSRHTWIFNYIEEEEFQKDTLLYIKDCLKKNEYREAQRPYLEKQKALAKEQRKKEKECKMAKEMPSKAQISYYKAICKKMGFLNDKQFLSEGSKLDFRNKIDEMLKLSHEKEKTILLKQLRKQV